MRIWSLHPSLLDRQGLVACWRETLLAQAVLLGRTRGYIRHPQLARFRSQPAPAASVAAYLQGLHEESLRRDYRFNAERIDAESLAQGQQVLQIPVTTGQLNYEWAHLERKLEQRSPQILSGEPPQQPVPTHPLFLPVPGEVESWERAADPGRAAG